MYSGWSNWETWEVVQHLDLPAFFETFADALRQERVKEPDPVNSLMTVLKEAHIAMLFTALEENSLYRSLALEALQTRVNWREIAETAVKGEPHESE